MIGQVINKQPERVERIVNTRNSISGGVVQPGGTADTILATVVANPAADDMCIESLFLNVVVIVVAGAPNAMFMYVKYFDGLGNNDNIALQRLYKNIVGDSLNITLPSFTVKSGGSVEIHAANGNTGGQVIVDFGVKWYTYVP